MTEPHQSSPSAPSSPSQPQSDSVPAKRAKSKPLPDWTPLGTVRDYFNEQMKQDHFR